MSSPKITPPSTRFPAALAACLAMMLSGCAGITAVNIPGLGYFDFDPPPVTSCDKALMYQAVAAAACQGRKGAFAEWFNPATGHHGSYEVTRLTHRTFAPPGANPLYGPHLPAAEVTEFIHAGGRDFRTLGVGVYLERNGRWYRYK